jgi:hypothetical protein
MMQEDEKIRRRRSGGDVQDYDENTCTSALPGRYHYNPERMYLAPYRYRWDAFKWDGPIRSLAISCLMECLANFFITLPAVLTIAECLLGGQDQAASLTTQQIMAVSAGESPQE